MIKTLAILGSTGSIGTQALEVCDELGIQVTSMSCGRNVELIYQQAVRCQPRLISVEGEEDAKRLELRLKEAGLSTEVQWGEAGNLAVASDPEAEMVLAAMVGMAGLTPVVRALETGHDLALANKETLVAGGDIVMRLAAEKGLRLHPVDSEHSAIWQCLAGTTDATREVDHLILTASGGPFRGRTRASLEAVTREEALRHPTWKMGGKISIDSATLMNKGLELIEAVQLFGVTASQVQVVVHPESIVHSAVAFRDGATLAQLSWPDMKLPIRLAFTYPERGDGVDLPAWDPIRDGRSRLTFEAPDEATFGCLSMARQAAEQGGDAPIILNAANEVAVEAFLAGRVGFLAIEATVAQALEALAGRVSGPILDLETVLQCDREARDLARGALY